MHHPPDARNNRCNSSSEQSGPAPSKMERHGHLPVLEWHEPSGVVSYIDLNRLEVRVHQRHVVNVSEPIRYRGAVTSTNREDSQQRCETFTDYARLHDIRVDVDGIVPFIHLHHIVGLFTVGVRTIGSLFRWCNHSDRRCETDISSTQTRVGVHALSCIGAGGSDCVGGVGGLLIVDASNPNILTSAL